LAEYALGWLGWSEKQALSADVNAILVGYTGKMAMLKAVFGGEDEAEEPEKLEPMTADAFRGVFGAAAPASN
jgi:hypothetical protein